MKVAFLSTPADAPEVVHRPSRGVRAARDRSRPSAREADTDDCPADLVRVDPAGPGLTRRRRGRGFSYHDASGAVITDHAEIARLKALVIPPAWQDVWISPDRTATSRRWAPTRPAVASTATTTTGAGPATWSSTTAC